MTTMDIASIIDHTALKPETTTKQICQLCAEAIDFSFASVCVNPVNIPIARNELQGSGIPICTVIGFPLGASSGQTKAFETIDALKKGASEFDVVIAIRALQEGNNDYVLSELKGVVSAAAGNIVKVIIETALLSYEEKKRACRLSVEAGADFVKTSTGFATSGARAEDVKLMRQAVGSGIGVKASGGIRSLETAQEMICAGANRIGTSSGVKIVQAAG